MPSLYRVGSQFGPQLFHARKRDAIKGAREWSRHYAGDILVFEIEAARLPLLDLLAAALNGDGWSEGDAVLVGKFREGIEQREAPPEPPPAPPVRTRERAKPAPRIRERVRA